MQERAKKIFFNAQYLFQQLIKYCFYSFLTIKAYLKQIECNGQIKTESKIEKNLLAPQQCQMILIEILL